MYQNSLARGFDVIIECFCYFEKRFLVQFIMKETSQSFAKKMSRK